MVDVIKNAWALLLGMFLLMIGNGMQGTVLGVRGSMEAFDPSAMGFVMAGYFLGFLSGAQLTPMMIRRVGHVRVFAALASIVSALFILYAVLVNPVTWFLLRLGVGFSISGIYVVCESWLNEASSNDQRGQTMSVYLMIQMGAIILAQPLINLADPGGYGLFVIMSVMVSIAITPALLSASKAPAFDTARKMSFRELFKASPLGCVGTFLLGGVMACIFGMASVYATERGFTTPEVSIFLSTMFAGSVLFQFPVGWLSDRMDRRVLIAAVSAIGVVAAAGIIALGEGFVILTALGLIVGGTANPLYSLIIAYTNDYLETDQMASAASGMIVLHGIGAAMTPVIVGFLMETVGPSAFVAYVGALLLMICAYAVVRMTARAAPSVEETRPVAVYGPATTPVSAEYAQDYVMEATSEDDDAGDEAAPEDKPAAPAIS